MGLAQKVAQKPQVAADYFAKTLSCAPDRYDAAVELASQKVILNCYSEARDLLDRYKDALGSSAAYLDMAAQAYVAMGMYQEAWPLYEKAMKLQPGAAALMAHMATCAVYVGKVEKARAIYKEILRKYPKHQRTHYDLAQLERARDDQHIKKMMKVLQRSSNRPADNIYLYYALGKEHEDLGRWREAFRYYEQAGAAVKSVSNYDVAEDVDLMAEISLVCTADWLKDNPSTVETTQTPIFIVGLPRTGTTLTDRILSSHSKVQSAGESQLLQMVLRDGTRAGNQIGITKAQIGRAANRDPATIAAAYHDALKHRLGDEAYFVEKLPENVLYLGFIAKSWPNAKIVHLHRHPMDACFAVFKQSFFRFAYSLDDLAEYYLAYHSLSRHWSETLGDRIVDLSYEALVADQEGETRRLLHGLGLDFEEACLNFEKNAAPVATASSAQVREKVHSRSVARWKNFEKELQPLRARIERGGVVV